MAFSDPIVGGSGGTLVINQIQSNNYVANTSGWQIAADGDAEFNDVTITGELLGH